MKDPAVEKTEIILEALNYAHVNNLDINKATDVKKILENFDPEHSSEKDVEAFIKLLQAANALLEENEKRRGNLN